MDFVTILQSSFLPDQKEVFNQIFPNVWVFVSHTLATILLFTLVTKLVWKQTKKYLANRQKIIQADLTAAAEQKKASEIQLAAANEKLLASKNLANQIISKAQLDAKDEQKKIEDQTKRKVNTMLVSAEMQITKQELELKKQMNEQILNLALHAAETFLNKKIDAAKDQELMQQIVDDLQKNTTPNKP